MFTPHMQGYGYGWQIGETTVGDRTVRIVEHGGAIPGFVTAFRRIPVDRSVIVVMDNASGEHVEDLVEGITQLLYDGQAVTVSPGCGMS